MPATQTPDNPVTNPKPTTRQNNVPPSTHRPEEKQPGQDTTTTQTGGSKSQMNENLPSERH